MKAIILAAGRGRRLGELATVPKVLLEFGGKTLFCRHIEMLEACGVTDVTVVVGYRGEWLRAEAERCSHLRASFLENPRFAEGSILSLLRAREVLESGDDILLLDGDVLYDWRLLSRLVDCGDGSRVLVDRRIEPGDEPVKLCIEDGRIVDFAKRPEQLGQWRGESVGFFRLTAATAAALATTAARMASGGGERLEYEAPLREIMLAETGGRFRYEDVTDLPWIEIDFAEDVLRAETEILPLLASTAIGAAPCRLDDDARDSLKHDGFAYLPGLFDDPSTAELARWIDEIAMLPETPVRQWIYREKSVLDGERSLVQRIENFTPYHRGFDRLLRRGRLAALAGEVLGEPAVLFKEKVNFKMSGGGGFEPHQDQQAGWSRYAPYFLTILVSIDPATVDNGCLEIAPGRHREGMIGAEWRPLDELDPAAYRPAPTGPGDVLVFGSYLPHGSRPNLSAGQRRMLYVTYNSRADGDLRARYHADKFAAFPPDAARLPGREYIFRV